MLAVAGCTWRRETIIEESAYQLVRAADTAQSLRGVDLGYTERSGLFGSAWLLGHHPTKGDMIAFDVGEAAAHLATTAVLERYAPAWCVRTWEAGSIAIEANVVRRNYLMGLTLRF